MKTHVFAVCFVWVAPVVLTASNPCADQRSQRVDIRYLKSRAELYERQRILVSGILKSGHLGVFLQGPNGSTVKVVDAAESSRGVPARVCGDALLRRFWELASETRPDPETKRIYTATVEGILVLLRHNGRRARDFDIFGQWPLELVLTRVRSIREVEKPQGK